MMKVSRRERITQLKLELIRLSGLSSFCLFWVIWVKFYYLCSLTCLGQLQRGNGHCHICAWWSWSVGYTSLGKWALVIQLQYIVFDFPYVLPWQNWIGAGLPFLKGSLAFSLSQVVNLLRNDEDLSNLEICMRMQDALRAPIMAARLNDTWFSSSFFCSKHAQNPSLASCIN